MTACRLIDFGMEYAQLFPYRHVFRNNHPVNTERGQKSTRPLRSCAAPQGSNYEPAGTTAMLGGIAGDYVGK
jgi:hypothetical protein